MVNCKFDLPDQDVHSLSRFLHVGIVLEVLIVIGFLIAYHFTVWTGVAPADATVNETIIQISIVLFISTSFGFYGAWAKDRGYLLGAAICQMMILNTVHPFFPDTRLKAIASVSSGIAIIECWIFLRAEQKIEDENVQAQRLGARKKFGCFDLPDQNVKSLSKWQHAAAAIIAVLGGGLIGIAYYFQSVTAQRNVQMLGGSMLISAAFGVAGAITSRREALTYAFVLSLFDIAKINLFFTTLINYKNTATDALQLKLYTAAVIVYYISIVCSGGHAWVNLRLAQKIQVDELENQMAKDGQVAERQEVACCCRTAGTVAIRRITKVIGACAILELFLAIACISLAGHLNVVADFTDFNIFFAVIMIVAGVSVLYGIWALDKGWLLFYAILQVWVMAQSWRSWQSTMSFLQGWGQAAQVELTVYVALVVLYWVVAIVSSALGVYLSETLNDLDAIRLSYRSGELSDEGDLGDPLMNLNHLYHDAYSTSGSGLVSRRRSGGPSTSRSKREGYSVTTADHDMRVATADTTTQKTSEDTGSV